MATIHLKKSCTTLDHRFVFVLVDSKKYMVCVCEKDSGRTK
jgi:hypothetical protein